MRLLELFSGTKSVGKVAEALGYEVVSLDLKDADINCDILNGDYTVFEPRHFDVIWASPPCTEYSKAKTTGVRLIDKANEIVITTLRIIEYLKPKCWMLENPQTGLLKKQTFMCDLPFHDVDYCKYSDWGYRKRTRIWTNLTTWKPRQPCKKDCLSIRDGRHIGSCGNGRAKYTYRTYTQRDKYAIPPDLIYELLQCVPME